MIGKHLHQENELDFGDSSNNPVEYEFKNDKLRAAFSYTNIHLALPSAPKTISWKPFFIMLGYGIVRAFSLVLIVCRDFHLE